MGLEIYYVYEFTLVVIQILLLQEMRKLKPSDPKETNFTKNIVGTI